MVVNMHQCERSECRKLNFVCVDDMTPDVNALVLMPHWELRDSRPMSGDVLFRTFWGFAGDAWGVPIIISSLAERRLVESCAKSILIRSFLLLFLRLLLLNGSHFRRFVAQFLTPSTYLRASVVSCCPNFPRRPTFSCESLMLRL